MFYPLFSPLFLLFPPIFFCRLLSSAPGVDSQNNPMVGEPRSREHHAGHAAEVGGFPGLQTTSQTTQSSGEMSAGDQLQHTADQTPP